MGTTGQNEKLFATAIFGVVKFVSSLLCAVFLIDWIGRKRALMSGITLQFIAMLYMALFLVIDTDVGEEGATQSPSQESAAKGAIAMIYVSGFGWALGWNSIQYLINSEIYPLRLRAIGGSFAMSKFAFFLISMGSPCNLRRIRGGRGGESLGARRSKRLFQSLGVGMRKRRSSPGKPALRCLRVPIACHPCLLSLSLASKVLC